MNGVHAFGMLTADNWINVAAIVMALTLVIGNLVTRGARIPRHAWPALIWMALVWAGIIATAALAFRHFRPGGF